jgi:hypothetical protein
VSYFPVNTPNAPLSDVSFIVTTILTGFSLGMQIAQYYDGEAVHDTYIRQYVNDGWKTWRKMTSV